MTQITHYDEYPETSEVARVNVWMHDSLMAARHDYSCPVCREAHAVLDLSSGLMQPCRGCQKQGYTLKRKTWIDHLMGYLGAH